MNSNIGSDNTINNGFKDFRALNNEELVEVQRTVNGYVLVQRGKVGREKLPFPQYLAESYGRTNQFKKIM